MRPTDADAPSTLQRLRRLTWWSSAGLTLAAGGLFASTLLRAGLSRGATAAAGGGTLLACASAAWLLHRRLGPSAGRAAAPAWTAARWAASVAVAGIVGAILVGVVLAPTGQAVWWPLIPALVISGVAVSVPRGGRLGTVALGGALVAVGEGAGTWVDTGAVNPTTVVSVFVLVGVVGAAMISQLWIWDVAERLDAVRRMSAELAVADERLRFAADLHDVQGHHLQVIALKSELAARVAERDPNQAAEEMREVHRLAQTALHDTRAVVQGYRRPTLDTELANATKVLGAAGIDCRGQHDPGAVAGRLGEGGRELLGSVVREATTNVLRHSRARRACVRLEDAGDRVRLEVTNDGAGPGPDGRGGTGLATLAQRLAAADGLLEWRRDGSTFTVTASVPAGAGTPAPPPRAEPAPRAEPSS